MFQRRATSPGSSQPTFHGFSIANQFSSTAEYLQHLTDFSVDQYHSLTGDMHSSLVEWNFLVELASRCLGNFQGLYRKIAFCIAGLLPVGRDALQVVLYE